MSEVMKCDICGAIYNKEYGHIRIEEKRMNGADLCPACIERFHQWLDSSTNEKEVVSADNDPTVEEIDQEHNYIRRKNEIRIGDVLYEPSTMYQKVIEHKIVDIYMNKFTSGWGTIITTESWLGRNRRYASSVKYWYLTKEDAQKELDKRIKTRKEIWDHYESGI